MDTKSFVEELEKFNPDEKKEAYRGFLSHIPTDDAVSELGKSLSTQSTEDKNSAADQLKKIAAAIGTPSQSAADRLWLIVVIAFSTVLVGGFITLAFGMFLPPASNGVKPELILTTFTSVVGFLAGLFVPSPAGQNGK